MKKVLGWVVTAVALLIGWGASQTVVPYLFRPKPLTTQELIAKVDQEVTSKSESMKSLKRNFPEFYNQFLLKLVPIARQQNSDAELKRLATNEVMSFRKQHMAIIATASDSNLKLLLGDALNFYRESLAIGGESECDLLFRRGPAAMSNDFVKRNARAIDMSAARSFEIIRSTIDQRLTSPGGARDEDWMKVTSIMLAGGATNEEMDKLASAETDLTKRNLCPVGIKMVNAVLAVDGDAGRRLRSTFVKLMMQ